MARVLVVDDEKCVRRTLEEFIKEEGHVVHTAGDVGEAMRRLEQMEYDVVVADIVLPVKNGLDLLKNIRKTRPNTQVVMITGTAVESAEEALSNGAYDFLVKPVDRQAVRKMLAEADIPAL